MSKNTVKTKTVIEPIEFIKEFQSILLGVLKCHETELTLNTNLTYIGLDSLDTLDIIMKMENKFSIRMLDEEFANYTNITISDLLKSVANKLVENHSLSKDVDIFKIYQTSISRPTQMSVTIQQPINTKHKRTPPKELIDEYNATIAKLNRLEQQLRQY